MNSILMRQVAGHFRTNPESHDQAEWCGTSMCVAGWALALSGYDLEESGLPHSAHVMRSPDGSEVLHADGIAARAITLLDLTEDEADALFYSVTYDPEAVDSYAEALDLIADGIDIEVVLL